MSFFDLFKGRKSEEEKVPTPGEYKETRTYDYSTPENRVSTAEWLFEQARMERTAKESEWMKYDDYYNFAHDTSKNAAESLDEMEVPFIPATVPEPYIMVESQITPDVPMPEFHGRDEDDDEKARERQLAVRYVMENNRINDMNTSTLNIHYYIVSVIFILMYQNYFLNNFYKIIHTEKAPSELFL